MVEWVLKEVFIGFIFYYHTTSGRHVYHGLVWSHRLQKEDIYGLVHCSAVDFVHLYDQSDDSIDVIPDSYEEEKLDNLLANNFFRRHRWVYSVPSLFEERSVDKKFAVGFTNSTFIGIPLVSSIMGAENTYLLSAYVIWFNIFNFGYGVYMISRNWKNVSLKKFEDTGFCSSDHRFCTVCVCRFGFEAFSRCVFRYCEHEYPSGHVGLWIYLARTDFLQLARDQYGLRQYDKTHYCSSNLFNHFETFARSGRREDGCVDCNGLPGAMALPMMAAIYGADDILGARLVTHSRRWLF